MKSVLTYKTLKNVDTELVIRLALLETIPT